MSYHSQSLKIFWAYKTVIYSRIRLKRHPVRRENFRTGKNSYKMTFWPKLGLENGGGLNTPCSMGAQSHSKFTDF